MTNGDSNHVTQKQFYDAMREVSDRIVGKIDGVKEDIATVDREVGEIKISVEAQEKKLNSVCDDVQALEDRERGMIARSSAIGGAIGSTVAAILDYLKRNQI